MPYLNLELGNDDFMNYLKRKHNLCFFARTHSILLVVMRLINLVMIISHSWISLNCLEFKSFSIRIHLHDSPSSYFPLLSKCIFCPRNKVWSCSLIPGLAQTIASHLCASKSPWLSWTCSCHDLVPVMLYIYLFAKLCQSIFQRQIALYSPCWSSVVVTFCHH